ncbi:MAG: sigma-70 family RNA polymerase sigma factor [Candidatus Palauibacterales bacterium]|nr:sigma-70 family RNA polymerase sigma factor [Candidatus Palauibacterales bacterium]
MTDERELLARSFEAHRDHLRGIAYRMLGSAAAADDAVQEAWLRVSRAGAEGVDNPGGWMTTIVSRVCLDALRARRARGEEALASHEPERRAGRRHERSPEEEAELADSVGLALLVVLETLKPAERIAFVLHDMFDVPFDEIARVVDRTPAAARQLASRARRRVRGADASDLDRSRRREVVEAFIAAARAGDFEALVAVLDPDVVFRGDSRAVRMGGPAEVRGAGVVAEFFDGRADAAVPGLIDGEVGILVPVKGRMLLVLRLAFGEGRITGLEAVADRDALASLELEQLDPLDDAGRDRPDAGPR